MDELELLKKDWQKQEVNLPRLSYDQIYKMIWKKSSSIVKWIFVISILEFLFWSVLTLFLADKDYWIELDRIHLKEFTIFSYIVSYGITFYFIYRFYRNYIRISSTDNVSALMENILNTRRTVKYYIAFVLISTGAVFLIVTYFTFYYHAVNTSVTQAEEFAFSPRQWAMFMGIMFLILIVFLGLIWLFYRLIYGILLRRLKRNYKELKKLEM